MMLLDALGARPHLFAKSKEAIEHAKTAEPYLICDTLKSMTESFLHLTTKRELLYMEAARDHQLKAYKGQLKFTFNDHARSLHNPKLTQFDLLPRPNHSGETPTLDHVIKELMTGTEVLQDSLNDLLGKENYLLAVQLMAYPSSVGLHCALMFSSRYQLSRTFVSKTLNQKLTECLPGTKMFDTCYAGSPFSFRGMAEEQAEHAPLTKRLENITSYFASGIEVVACGWPSLHRERFLVGPLVRTQPSFKVASYRTSRLQDFQSQVLNVSPDEPAVSGKPLLTSTASAA
jgi:hypothetical protein